MGRILDLAQASARARSWDPKIGEQILGGPEAQFVVGDDYLSFAGSRELVDWIRDADAVLVPAPWGYPGKVHRGFLRASEDVWDDVLEVLPVNDPIYIGGHSFGGAVAVLVAARLAQIGRKVEVVTFGCPKVGSKRFTRAVKVPILRVVNWPDPVTWLPFWCGWRHVGRKKQIWGEYWWCPIFNHRIDEYIESIQRSPLAGNGPSSA